MFKILFLNKNLKIVSRIVSTCAYCTTVVCRDIFKGATDRFKGITIDSRQENVDQQYFVLKLDESLSNWLTKGNKCVWFKVNIKDAFCIPLLAKKGFNFHHARDDFVVMYKWLPVDSKPTIPPPCHTNLGVGAMVFNDKHFLLAVSEQHYEYPHWKLPGGFVERGEDFIDAAVREVKEETGVDAKFESLVTIRHTHNMMFENTDIYIVLMMKAVSDKIIMSQKEVKICKWMDVEEYASHPHVHKFNRLMARKALEYKTQRLKLDIQKNKIKWPTYEKVVNFLVIGEFGK